MSWLCNEVKPVEPDPDPPAALNVADLKIGGVDLMGAKILAFYGRKPPDYAIYRTLQRVCVQFADDKAEADSQRHAIARLNPLRGEINGLIDGWRLKPKTDRRYRRAERFDRLVGDALVVAFEEDVPDAETLLTQIKQTIYDERVAWARFEYLIWAFSAAVLVVLLEMMRWSIPVRGNSLWAAASAGAVGAFFSIAIGIRNRTVLTDLLWLANTMDAILRVLIGVIGAVVLMALIDVKVVTLGFGTIDFSPAAAGHLAWLHVLLIGFIAGFSERLVPDLLDKAAAKPADPPPLRRDADRQPAAGRIRDPAHPNGPAAAIGDAEIDPDPDQAGVDHCLCDIHMPLSEATEDEHLPPASGGVAVLPKL